MGLDLRNCTLVARVLAAASLVTLAAATLPARLVKLWDGPLQVAGCGLAAAMASTVAFSLFQGLWNHSSELSIQGVRWVLEHLHFQVLTAGQSVGTDRFFVRIAPACSGYEGMGLFLASSIGWLAWFRKEYRFPAALILLPVGLAVSWCMNVLRIAGLIVIGHYGRGDIALGSFHSRFDWLTDERTSGVIACFAHGCPTHLIEAQLGV